MTTIKEQNKKEDFMSQAPNLARGFFPLLISLFVVLLFTACLNPFQAGLGDRVDIDRPLVTLSSPEPGEFLRGVVTFSGTASDDVSVRTVQISFSGGATWYPVTSFDQSTGQWTHTVDTREAFANTRISVRVRVIDGSGKQTTTEDLLFTVDNEAPQIFFVFPRIDPLTYNEANPPTVGKNGAIFGTITDREGIALDHPEVKFWADTGVPSNQNEPSAWTSIRPTPEEGADPNPAVYDFRFNLPTEVTGPHWIRVAAEDVGGQRRETEVYRVVIISGAPQISISAPDQGDAGRGTVRIEGTATHETGNRPELELRLTARNDSTVTITVPTGAIGGTGDSWYYDVDSTTLPNDTIIVEAFARIGDMVGFDTVVFTVDNHAPALSVTSPGFLDTVYSMVTIRGTASDNERLETVSLKIGADDFFVLSGTFNWQHTFDSNLYGNPIHATEVNPSTGEPLADTGVWRLPILVQAEDRAGNTQTVEHLLYIDQDLDKPTVNILSPLAGSNLAGPVLITGTAFDADPGVARVEIQIVAVSDANEVIGNVSPTGVAMAPGAWHVVSGTTQWSREINGNGQLYSVTAAGGAYSGSTLVHNGRLRVRVRAVDLGGKEGNTQELAIRLDDTIPSITNISPASGSYVSGTVMLTATVTDDEEIVSVAYSVDGGTTYTEVFNGAGTGTKSYEFSESINTATGGLIIESAVRNLRIRVRDNANYTTISTVVLNVDNYWPDADLSSEPDNPMEMTGPTFQLRGTAWDRDKEVADNQFPVRGIDSIDVAFEDRRTGSATLGEFYRLVGGSTVTPVNQDLGNGQGPKPIVISADHRIRIDRTHIGSVDFKALEIDLSDVAWWTRVNTTDLPDGPVQIHLLITDRAGNRTHRQFAGFVRNNPPVVGTVTVGADLNYDNEVSAAEQFSYADVRFNVRNRLFVSPAISGGNGSVTWQLVNETAPEVPLSLQNGNTLDVSGYSDGDYTFIVRATDSVGIVAAKNILVRIAQQDTTPPTVAIAALPVAVDGHVEPTSPHNAGRPSVSGTVLVSGTASDNQRIRELLLSVPGVGTNVLAAAWEVGTTNNLVSRLAGFTILSSTIDEQNGHQVSWSYQWNSAMHPDVAALGVNFQISAQDFRSGSPAAVTATRIVDVVPYITDVRGELEPGTRRFIRRTATGGYPSRRGQTVEIIGYNLVGPGTGINLPGAIIGTTGTGGISFTLGATAISDYLVVTVNNVASINNINNNSLSHNQEPEAYRPHLTDDRFLFVWETVSDTSLSGRTDAVMGRNAAGTGFDWMTVQNSQSVFIGSQQLTNSWNLAGGSFTRNADGTLMYLFLHDMNWNSGQDGYQFHGSVQFGIGDGNQNLAANWQNVDTNRLGLGNLSFISDPNWPGFTDKVMARYRNLQLSTSGGNIETRVYAAYFDTSPLTRGIVTFTFRVGTGTNYGITRMANMGGRWYSDLTKEAERTDDYAAGVTGGTRVGLRTPQNRVTVTSGGEDSEHFDLLLSGGALYLAYYDESSGRFLFRYNTNPASNPTAWSAPRELDVSAGLYPSMAVDPAGGIHMAYYDTAQGNLKYIYLPNRDAPANPVVVDALFTNGMYTSLAVREFGPGDHRPVITHFSLSYSGTRYPLRLSYPLSSAARTLHGADSFTGNYTGQWEMVPVMADIAPGPNATFTFTEGIANNVVIGFNGPHVQRATLQGLRP